MHSGLQFTLQQAANPAAQYLLLGQVEPEYSAHHAINKAHRAELTPVEVKMVLAPPEFAPARIHIAALTLRNFQNRENVEIQLFRPGGGPEELIGVKRSELVGPALPDMPPELIKGATEEAAIACLLETFTAEEIRQMTNYLKERYGEQIKEIAICPMSLPVPLGIGPLAGLPESATSGFINFDLAPGYPLDFPFRGYYDLGASQ